MLGKPNAEYFDGTSAHSHLAHVTYDGRNLTISRDGHPTVIWRITEVELVSGGKRGQALRLKQAGNHGSRLTLPEGDLADRIVDSQQHIRRGHLNRFFKGAAISVGIVVVLGVIGYAALAIAPSALAGFLPDKVVNSFADGLEKSVIKTAKRCNAPAGEAALNKMMKRVLSGAENPPTFSLRVFDIRQANKKQLVNAFALPGGRMVMSAGLIAKAQSPDEVAGVLAHELGHVALRHPEAAIVRVYGLQAIISIFTAGQGAETISSVAGILALLSYSREAEEEADAYASKVMDRAQIDPKGLRTFFTRLLERSPLGKKKTDGTKSAGEDADSSFTDRLKPLTDMFSTHPGTKSRIDRLKPRDGGSEPPILTDAEWQALKRICTTS
jgi:Zn-dependent protease with chaperone function